MKYVSFAIFSIFVLGGLTSHTYSQSKHPAATPPCSLIEYGIPCPKGLRVIGRDTARQLILAESKVKDDRYVLFLIDRNPAVDIEQTIKKEFIPKAFPTFQGEINWKEMEFENAPPGSKFEINKVYRMGFNGEMVVSFAYREIKVRDKHFYVGSVWRDESGGSPDEMKEFFEDVTGGTEGGCDRAVQTIRAITKEKPLPSSSNHPCIINIMSSPMTPPDNR